MSLVRDLCYARGRAFYLAVVGRFFIKLVWSLLNDIFGVDEVLCGAKKCMRNAIKTALINPRAVWLMSLNLVECCIWACWFCFHAMPVRSSNGIFFARRILLLPYPWNDDESKNSVQERSVLSTRRINFNTPIPPHLCLVIASVWAEIVLNWRLDGGRKSLWFLLKIVADFARKDPLLILYLRP